MRLLLWDEQHLGLSPIPLNQDLGDLDLASVCRTPATPWVRANMVSTVDGSATDEEGVSGGINTAADRLVFDAYRAVTDVVLVGAGTVRAEGYTRLTVEPSWRAARAAAGHTHPPTLAVLTRGGELPDRVLTGGQSVGRLLVLVTAQAPEEAVSRLCQRIDPADVLRLPTGADLATVVDLLRRRGLANVLCEGGPSLLSELTRQDCLDEVCLTVSPLLVAGNARRIMGGPPMRQNLHPVVLLEQDGTLLGRWITRSESR